MAEIVKAEEGESPMKVESPDKGKKKQLRKFKKMEISFYRKHRKANSLDEVKKLG